MSFSAIGIRVFEIGVGENLRLHFSKREFDFKAPQRKSEGKWPWIAGSVEPVEEDECVISILLIELKGGLPRTTVPSAIFCSHDLDRPAPIAQDS